jgi:hypothetical protein
MHTYSEFLLIHQKFVTQSLGGLMSLADYPNQCAAFFQFMHKIDGGRRVWQIKWQQINKNSLCMKLFCTLLQWVVCAVCMDEVCILMYWCVHVYMCTCVHTSYNTGIYVYFVYTVLYNICTYVQCIYV